MLTEEDEASLAFLHVSRVPTKFIEPAPTDVPMMYVPPPQLQPKFPFKRSLQGQYSTIYALLVVIDRLINLHIEGAVDGDLFEQELEPLKQQFERVNQVVGFNRQAIKAFARACSLQCPLAIDHLLPANEKRGTGNMAKVTAACAIGEGLTTLIDMAYLDNVTVESVFPQIGGLQLNYRIIENNDEEILRRLQFWANFCRTKSMSAVLSAEEKNRLKEDAEFMRAITK